MSRSTNLARLEALEAQCGESGTLADALKAMAARDGAESDGAEPAEIDRLNAEVDRAVGALPADVVAELSGLDDDEGAPQNALFDHHSL